MTATPRDQFNWIALGVVAALVITLFVSLATVSNQADWYSSNISSNTSTGLADTDGARHTLASIASDSSCVNLQATFDRADANGERYRAQGRLDMSRLMTDYMTAAHERMAEIGCYG